MTQTEAMKLALEAFQRLDLWLKVRYQVGLVGFELDAIKALEEALAKQEHDLQDTRCECCGYMTHQREHMGCIRSAKQEQGSDSEQLGEPVAMRYDFDGYGYKYIDSGSGSDWQTRIKDAEPLYTTPQQRKPLTNEQITKAFNEAMSKRPKDASNAETNRLFVRAIEAEIEAMERTPRLEAS